MIEGTSSLAPDGADDFWYYTADPGPVTVSTVGGPARTAVAAPDPNGVQGWRVRLAGPEATTDPTAVTLTYGRNALQVHLGAVAVDGGRVYVGPPNTYLDVYDPWVYSFVTTGTGNPGASVPTPVPFAVEIAVQVASEILGGLTGIHPAGTAVEDFQESSPIHRISPYYGPLTGVDYITRNDPRTGSQVVAASTYQRAGNSLIFPPWRDYWLFDSYQIGWAFGSQFTPCDVGHHAVIQVGYRFSSTITAASRRAIAELAHEFWLQGTGQDCALPARTTSITREGLSIQVSDPQDFLDKGRVGIGSIDLFISAMTGSSRALRRSGIYTPDAPPGVVRSYRTTL